MPRASEPAGRRAVPAAVGIGTVVVVTVLTLVSGPAPDVSSPQMRGAVLVPVAETSIPTPTSRPATAPAAATQPVESASTARGPAPAPPR